MDASTNFSRTAIRAALLAIALAATPGASAAEVELVSKNSALLPAAGESSQCALAGGGRFIAFSSDAQDLASGSSSSTDVFVRDLATGEVELISRAANGGVANGSSSLPSISADGRFVAFASTATNLTSPPTTAATQQIFRHDRQTGVTTLVSRTANGTQANSSCSSPNISGDGQVVAFTTLASNLDTNDDNARTDVYCFDVASNRVRIESISAAGQYADGSSFEPSLDFDGDRMTFSTDATNITNDDTNGVTDVVLRNRTFGNHGSNRRTSDSDEVAEPNGRSVHPRISADGRTVVFASDATNLVPGDTNGVRDVFAYGAAFGTVRINVTADGVQATRAADFPVASKTGRFVAFRTSSPEFAGDVGTAQCAFVADSSTGIVRLVSRRVDGGAPANNAESITIDEGGARIAFASRDDGMVEGDANGAEDVFIERAAFFTPGDVLAGDTRDFDEVRELAVDGIKGMKLTFTMQQAPADTELEIRLVNPSGSPGKKVSLENDDDDTLKLTKDGLFRLRVVRKDGGDGAFRIATTFELPKNGRGFEKDGVDLDAGDDFDAKVAALPGSRLRFRGLIHAKDFGAWECSDSITRPDAIVAFASGFDTEFSADRPTTSFSVEIPIQRTGKHAFEFEALSGVDVEVDFSSEVTPPDAGLTIAIP